MEKGPDDLAGGWHKVSWQPEHTFSELACLQESMGIDVLAKIAEAEATLAQLQVAQ